MRPGPWSPGAPFFLLGENRRKSFCNSGLVSSQPGAIRVTDAEERAVEQHAKVDYMDALIA